MDLKYFKESLNADTPPDGLGLALQAMWYEAKGDWDTAHNLAQEKNDRIGAWVHAYLHRREGDISNAHYWYSRARQDFPQESLEQEWEIIVQALLDLA